MAKIGVGVGEDFPVDDPQPPKSPSSGDSPPLQHHRHGFWHGALHVTAKLAFVALVIVALGWLFHGFGPPYPWHGPYAYTPGYHHFGFFPFFPVLLIVLLLFAFRRRHWGHHYYGHGCGDYGMRRWHDEMHRERGERI